MEDTNWSADSTQGTERTLKKYIFLTVLSGAIIFVSVQTRQPFNRYTNLSKKKKSNVSKTFSNIQFPVFLCGQVFF